MVKRVERGRSGVVNVIYEDGATTVLQDDGALAFMYVLDRRTIDAAKWYRESKQPQPLV